MNSKTQLVTAALPYANGPLHIGHLAGSYLPADIFVRYHRLQNNKVLFVCGSDEHGAAITLRAKKENISPQEIIDKYHFLMKKTFEDFGISFDIYDRTSEKHHHELAQQLFLEMEQKGCFVKKTTQQYFDQKFQQFLADRYIMGECLICQNPNAYGDQCEKCGTALSPLELKNPISVLSGEKPVLQSTEHWYFPLDKYQDFLSEYLEKGSVEGNAHHEVSAWKTHVLGQCRSWLKEGLQERAMTRDLDWGVKVPLPNAEGKVLYVWFDAPIGYISATKKWAEQNGAKWEDFWKNPDVELSHFIGKDNIVFHCILFPAMLRATDPQFILPKNVPANEFLNLEGQKISTSRNWAVWAHQYLEDFPQKADELRYVLCATMPETKDASFSWQEFMDRCNNELVANLGNFVNRCMVLSHKYFGGQVPQPKALSELEQGYLEQSKKISLQMAECIENYRFKEALQLLMSLGKLGNQFFALQEPWKTGLQEPQKTKNTLYIGLQICGYLQFLMQPFLPFSAEKLKNILQFETKIAWKELPLELLPIGHQLGEPALLFEKINPELIQNQMEKLTTTLDSTTEKKEYPAQKPDCSWEDFDKIDLRTGQIVAAQKVPKTDKLLQLEVNLGYEKRTIVSGIANHFEVEKLIGQKIVVVANLAPKKLRGIESKGMILLADTGEKLDFVAMGSLEDLGCIVK